MVNIQDLFDDAKCYQTFTKLRARLAWMVETQLRARDRMSL